MSLTAHWKRERAPQPPRVALTSSCAIKLARMARASFFGVRFMLGERGSHTGGCFACTRMNSLLLTGTLAVECRAPLDCPLGLDAATAASMPVSTCRVTPETMVAEVEGAAGAGVALDAEEPMSFKSGSNSYRRV